MASRKQAQAPPQAPAQQHAYVPQTQPARSYFAAGPQVSHPIPGAVQGPAYYHPSPAAHHGQYIPSNAHNTPYPYSQSLPAHYPQRAAPPQRHTTPLTAPLLEDALLRVLEGSLEPLLSGQQERSSAAFAELASALSDIGRTFADEQVQMRAQVEALTKTVEHGQRIQLQATQAVFHRVGRLEKLVGVDGAIGEESDKSVWERLESIECDLGELLEKVKDPEAMLSPREPSPVRHEIATSPIPEQRKVYSNAGIGPQTPRREPEKVYANAGVSPRPSLTTSYLRGSLVGSLPASGSCLQIPAASIPPVRASSSASALAALQDIARMSARRKLFKPSAAFSDGGAPVPLTAADWSGAQTEPATSNASSGRSSPGPQPENSEAHVLEPDIQQATELPPLHNSSRDSSVIEGLLSPLIPSRPPSVAPPSPVSPPNHRTGKTAPASLSFLRDTSPLTEISLSVDGDAASSPVVKAETISGGRTLRRRQSTVNYADLVRKNVGLMTPSASVGPSKKRKGESASAGPSKRAKKGGRRVAKKTSVKMEEHKTSPLVMHPSMYCEWPEKMSGDAAFQRQFVQCDTCDLWFHYGCVAFVPNEDPWSCPACEAFPDDAGARREGMRGRSEMCSRPDCPHPGPAFGAEANEFFVERIVGRCIDASNDFRFLWLVKWDGYPIEQAEWLREEDMGDSAQMIQDFYDAAQGEGSRSHKGDVLLYEAVKGGWAVSQTDA